MPSDRGIEGLDMSGFFWGNDQRSGRYAFIVYVGDGIFGVKWRVFPVAQVPITAQPG